MHPPSPSSKSHCLLEYSLEELSALCERWGERSFRARQIFEWIYQKDVRDVQAMTNLPQAFRDRMERETFLMPLEVVTRRVSRDGTTKILFSCHDDENIESVLIPTSRRSTACLSTQAGCKFGCRFCASGIGGWMRNLTSGEILAQVLMLKEEARHHQHALSHLVFMGTGEPLDNFDHLMKAIRIINASEGLKIGARHITVSTVGIIPRMMDLARQGLQIELAVSLHGYDQASRNLLMPVNRKYPFDDLIQACREYVRMTRRQVTFEYICIKDKTCSTEAVRGLKKALKGLLCKLNLIPYNPVSEFDHQPPSREEILAFQRRLQEAGLRATVRMPRGQDIAAACGQLRHAAKRISEDT